jgi:hypothetical protein
MSRQKVLESAAVEMKETTNCASLEIQHQVGGNPNFEHFSHHEVIPKPIFS